MCKTGEHYMIRLPRLFLWKCVRCGYELPKTSWQDSWRPVQSKKAPGKPAHRRKDQT